MRRLFVALPLVAVVVAVVLFYGWSLRRSSQVTPMAMVGKPMPDISLADLNGSGRASLRSVVKGPALVNFYASWCAPCAQESPALMALKYEGVRIIGVAWQDAPGQAQAFLRRLGDPYAVKLADPHGSAGIDFGVTGVPETYAIDAQGVIRAKRATPLTPADGEALLEAASK